MMQKVKMVNIYNAKKAQVFSLKMVKKKLYKYLNCCLHGWKLKQIFDSIYFSN